MRKPTIPAKFDHVVYCTLTSGQDYTQWIPGSDLPRKGKVVSINGGAGVANKKLVTPYGATTFITAEDKDFLEAHSDFIAHRAGGWVKIVARGRLGVADADEVAFDMSQRDGASPIVPADFDRAQEQFHTPTVNGTADEGGTPPTTVPRSRSPFQNVRASF